MNIYTKSNRENAVFRCTRHYGSALYSYVAESLGRIVKWIVWRGAVRKPQNLQYDNEMQHKFSPIEQMIWNQKLQVIGKLCTS